MTHLRLVKDIIGWNSIQVNFVGGKTIFMERDNIPGCFSHTDYDTDYIEYVIKCMYKIVYDEENSNYILF